MAWEQNKFWKMKDLFGLGENKNSQKMAGFSIAGHEKGGKILEDSENRNLQQEHPGWEGAGKKEPGWQDSCC